MPRKERNELKKLAEMQEAAAGISNIKKFSTPAGPIQPNLAGRLLYTVHATGLLLLENTWFNFQS